MRKFVTILLSTLLCFVLLTASAQNAVVRTEKGNLNLRAKPREDAQVLARVPNGSEVTEVGEPLNGWCQVTYKGKTGYVMADFLVLEDATLYPDHAEPVFLRNRPDDDASIRAVLAYASPIIVLSTDGAWSYVSSRDGIGKAVTGYLRAEVISQGRTEPTLADDIVQGNAEARLTEAQTLYEWPDSASTSVITLPAEALVTVRSSDGAWSYIVTEQYSGYVHASALELTGNEAGLPEAEPPVGEPSVGEPGATVADEPTPEPTGVQPTDTPTQMPAESATPTPSPVTANEYVEAINGAVARGIADAALRHRYPAFADVVFVNVASHYITEDDAFDTPYYQFDYIGEADAYRAIVHAYTQKVLYLSAGQPEE